MCLIMRTGQIFQIVIYGQNFQIVEVITNRWQLKILIGLRHTRYLSENTGKARCKCGYSSNICSQYQYIKHLTSSSCWIQSARDVFTTKKKKRFQDLLEDILSEERLVVYLV